MEKLYITTSRLTIRNLNPADLDDFYAYRSNPVVARFQGYEPMSREQAQAFIADQQDQLFGQPGEWVQFGIEHAPSGRLIGDCAIKLDADDVRLAEFGITIAPQEQQNGFAAESVYGLLAFLFEQAGLHRVSALVDEENTASINLMKRVGFRQEGFFIEHAFLKGKWVSEYLFAMLGREWLPKIMASAVHPNRT